ncbi:MAG: hypothetical protein GY810_30435 [Aureispira sp.]|nr:hypothetical protein [Aureispira sp.]
MMITQTMNSFFRLGAIVLLGTLFTGTSYAQCGSWDKYPDGPTKAVEQHVIYRDLFKAKQYDQAFPIWEKLFETVQSPQKFEKLPATPRRHFKDGIKMYQEFMKADKTKAEEMLPKMIKLYDQMAECTGEKSSDRAYQAYYMQRFKADVEETVKVIEKAIELGKNQTPDMVFTSYASLSIYLFKNKKEGFDDEKMRLIYKTLKDIATDNIEKKTKNADKYKAKWEKVEKMFNDQGVSDKIFGCDYYVEKWKPEFEKAKDNMEQNKEILTLIKKKCGKDNDFYKAVDAVYAPYKRAQDSLEAVRNFGALCNRKKGAFREKQAKSAATEEEKTALKKEAFEWYEKAVEEATTPEECAMTGDEKGELAYRIAYNYYKKGSYGTARSWCRKAASLKSNWGEPYLLVGLMYAGSGKRCGPGTGWDSQVVVWAAMDEWNKAKKYADSKAKASQYLSKYRKYIPTKGDAFQRGVKEGSSYKIGCWIGVTTTARLRASD